MLTCKFLIAFVCCCVVSKIELPAAEMNFGFSKVDLTPTVPVRLSGYGNRDQPYVGIDEPLYARAMAMTNAGANDLHVLVSVDTIGFPGLLTQEIFERIQQKHKISRSRFVICGTHSHTAPHLGKGLSNLFSTPLTDVEQAAADAYTNLVRDKVIDAVDLAIQDLRPGTLQTGSGTATFARNRRVIKEGLWTGFGENPSGPVDHSLPILQIKDDQGKTRGLLFNYACHCTTFGGDYNRVNGDWAGYASKALEAANQGAVALCTIGCGADANPERNSQHAFEIAQRQGAEIAAEVTRLTGSELASITADLSTNFGFAGLPIDRPTDAELAESLKNSRPQVRKHAEVMIETKKRMGRLPESYPMPIQVWRFGNEFAMIFLGGEVCVEYALRIKKELPELAPGLTADRIWVSAYANDVFAYVAPERMQAEGGYEVDFSMIYYLQPGRWSSGTEDVIIRRVRELFKSQNLDMPLSVNEALESFTLPEGYEIDVIAAEPLIRDPINFAVDAQGRLWVVEMGDYPRGDPSSQLSPQERREPWDGPPAGRIKVLFDEDHDGKYDTAITFLDGLTFPTGVFPWREGVLISGAPDLIYARDTNGDLKCDSTEVLYTGFEPANPQHRVAGFEYGLDGWLSLSAGTNNKEIRSVKTGEIVNMSGRDCRIQPDSGGLEAVSGRSQYGRCRDDFGNWYGNSNSQPLFQFVIEDRQLSRNPHVASPSPRHHLTEPATAPPVYPTSRTLDRFNDLHAINRFTSACSPTVFRNQTLGADLVGSLLICEPVHNLVSRVMVDRTHIEFSGHRHSSEQQSEFLSSSDNWFRPVRLMTAPDGTLWVCDMYRHVIEHPEWIPEAWQAKLDLYAGYDRGRIYRVFAKNSHPGTIEDLTRLSSLELVEKLRSPNGWTRDTAQQLLVERKQADSHAMIAGLAHLIEQTQDSRVLVQAAATLNLIGDQPSPIRKLYRSEDPDVVIAALRTWGASSNLFDTWQPFRLASHSCERIQFELALAAGEANEKDATLILQRLLKSARNPWIRTALISSASRVADQLLAAAIHEKVNDPEILNPLLATLLGDQSAAGIAQLATTVQAVQTPDLQRQLLVTALEYLEAKDVCFRDIRQQLSPESAEILDALFQSSLTALQAGNLPGSEVATILTLTSFHQNQLNPAQVVEYLNPKSSPAVITAAIEALLRSSSEAELLKVMSEQTPATQAQIQTSILTRASGAEGLLAGLEAGILTLNDLLPATRNALENSPRPAIQTRFQNLLKLDVSSPTRLELIQSFDSALTLPGDQERGREVFKKACSTCHQHQQIGQSFGPQLSELKSKSNDYVLAAILDPNAAVEAKYRGYTLVTRDGKIFSGLILEETATSLKLIRPDGKAETILRANVEEIVNTGRSFMPEGLEKGLVSQDLSDLLAFLRTE